MGDQGILVSCTLLVEVFDCNEEVNGVSDVKHDCGKCRCCEGLGWEGFSSYLMKL